LRVYVVTAICSLGWFLAPVLAVEGSAPPEKAELTFEGGAGYFFQEVDTDIEGYETAELTWSIDLALRVKRFGAAYALTVEPDYAYREPGSTIEVFPMATAYHHDFYLRWFFLVHPPAAFSVAGCLDVTGIYSPPPPFDDGERVYGSFQPGVYLGCDLRPAPWLRASLQTGFMRRVKPTRRTGDLYQAWCAVSNTWASHLNASYWLWDFLGVGLRTSLYVDGPGEPRGDGERPDIGYPRALCWAVFVGPSISVNSLGSYF
jgi:hypothetical protein